MTFYTARARLVLPGSDWFHRMVEARRAFDGMPPVLRTEADVVEFCSLLDEMEGVFLLDLGDILIEDITLTFLHYNNATGVLVLSVNFSDEEPNTQTHAVPFDRLFAGQYDPEKIRLGQDDVAYVVARVSANGVVEDEDDVHVVQPEHEQDAPTNVCAATSIPHEFVEQLLALVA